MAPSRHREHPFGITVLLVEENVRQALAFDLDGDVLS
jgi:hypothetical protein